MVWLILAVALTGLYALNRSQARYTSEIALMTEREIARLESRIDELTRRLAAR